MYGSKEAGLSQRDLLGSPVLRTSWGDMPWAVALRYSDRHYKRIHPQAPRIYIHPEHLYLARPLFDTLSVVMGENTKMPMGLQ